MTQDLRTTEERIEGEATATRSLGSSLLARAQRKSRVNMFWTNTSKSSSQGRTRRPLTLVEMTIILSVIAILSAVLVPTVMSHIAQSRILRAKQDVKTLANAIAQLYQNTGFVPKTSDSRNGGPGVQAVDLLVSPGNAPALPVTSAGVTQWATGTTDMLEHHLYNNVPGYRLKGNDTMPGWNGPYIASPPAADPWGNRYMINIVYLDPTPNVLDLNGNLKSAVFVLSAGENGIVDTLFDQPVTDVAVGGDDIVHRLQ